MAMRACRTIAGVCLIVLVALSVEQCSRQPAAPVEAATDTSASLTPVLTIKELMEHIVDPTADWIFDAAVIDVTDKGVVEHSPASDEDWLKVERGALLLAESANLLKMPRAVAPPGTKATQVAPGEPAPELEPEAMQAMIEKDRARWNQHADGLRQAALDALPAIRSHDVEKLFDIGDKLDKACESCHLEYWYPGDKALVLEDQQKVATFPSQKK